MLQSARQCALVVRRVSWYWRQRWKDLSSAPGEKRQHDPLRIIFCGADDFSAHSLRALHALQQRLPSKVESIDVLCKTDKAVERGLKASRAPPIKAVATELGLRLHQIDSFRHWRSPTPYNLIVAVSFGFLVPSRILNGAKYGGLNVHPSLLPDLRGPAPIVHTLLKRRETTGVSLQNLHPTKFDHGTILAQSEGVPVPAESTPDQLLQKLGPLGADLLCEVIENGAFVPPLGGIAQDDSDSAALAPAPKITPEDKQIDWQTWTADEILLRNRALGDLWDARTFARCQASDFVDDKSNKRLIFHEPWAKMDADVAEGTAGEPELVLGPFRKGLTLGIRTVDNCVMVPEAVTIEGRKKGKGLQALNEELRRKKRGTGYRPPSST